MNQWQLPIVLGKTGLQVIFLSTGQIAFVQHGMPVTTFDTSPKGEAIVTSREGILVGDKKMRYNVAYTVSEDVRGWLKSFNMDNPFQ